MKSTKSTRQQHGNSDRKNGKRSDKATKLDRKSSRGMIYENEELRLRTININAEVERGQSDIKKLRRENEYLKKEIWVLRDECDRLNKRFKAKLADYDYAGCSHRASAGSGAYTARDSRSNSDDSDSCDSCRCNEDHCTEECCIDGFNRAPTKESSTAEMATKVQKETQPVSVPSNDPQRDNQTFVPAFDHLSVVSEEVLSNNDVMLQQTEHIPSYSRAISGSQSTIPSIMGPLTPLTPIELVANQLNDLQAMVPPLSYFENILQEHMGSSIGTNFDSAPTPRVVKHTNGWDYNLESPFAQRKVLSGHIVPSIQERRSEANLTTFVPVVTEPSSHLTAKANLNLKTESNRNPGLSAVETVAITTMPINTPPPKLNSPKNFFSPLKPRLRINTSLANNSVSIPEPPQLPALATKFETEEKKGEPPDIYVANGLASPYQQQTVPYAVVSEATRSFPHPMRSTSPLPDSVVSSQTKSVDVATLLKDVESISEDMLAIQLDKKKSQENIIDNLPEKMPAQTLLQEDKSRKPYRSEMNLLLTYDGSNPTITPTELDTASTSAKITTCDGNINGQRTRDATESPSPNVPAAMLPFPENHTYIGFETTASTTPLSPVASTIHSKKISQGPVLATVSRVATRVSAVSKGMPPLPPARVFPPPLSIRDPKANSTSNALRPIDLVPNKSQLYKAISDVTKCADVLESSVTKSVNSELVNSESKPTEHELNMKNPAQDLDLARKKARRVSIICGETNSPAVPDVSSNQMTPESEAQLNSHKRNTNNSNLSTTATTKYTPILYAGSCFDLPSALQNPAFKNVSHLSHSTPNSPHSSRRSNSNVEATVAPAASSNIHHHSRNNTIGMTSHEFAPRNSDEHIAVVAGPAKCSRRHSDGTVASKTQRISGTSGGGHHHRHHHHHQHSSSFISHNPHHSHQDSNQETGTSISDRNSNSLASSGDSSASFSLHSQRRKISISSHTGGKIPWCACWGNGCL